MSEKDEVTKAKEDAQWHDAAEKAKRMGITIDEVAKAVDIIRSISPEDGARLNDDIIAKRLAEAMGWKFIGMNEESQSYHWETSDGQAYIFPRLQDWDPANSGEDIWICLEWIQKTHWIEVLPGVGMRVILKDNPLDGIEGSPITYFDGNGMTPRHIAQAILKAVEG